MKLAAAASLAVCPDARHPCGLNQSIGEARLALNGKGEGIAC
jgi:hypothetical protein